MSYAESVIRREIRSPSNSQWMTEKVEKEYTTINNALTVGREALSAKQHSNKAELNKLIHEERPTMTHPNNCEYCACEKEG